MVRHFFYPEGQIPPSGINRESTKNNNTSSEKCLSQHGYQVLQNDILYNEFGVVSFIKCFQVSDYCSVPGGHRI